MKRIPLTQGKYAIVDDEDYVELSKSKWCVTKKHRVWYAVRGTWVNSRYRQLKMHKEIMLTPDGLEIDHRNGNGLDNRRENLRICSHAENIRNQRTRNVKKTSRYKGVSWDKINSKWKAQIGFQNRQMNLGRYLSEITAAKVYDEKAKELFGEFAHTNF